jgi:hypothetical protein
MIIFHQHQQYEQSPLILTEHKKITTYDVGNPVPGLEQAQKCLHFPFIR